MMLGERYVRSLVSQRDDIGILRKNRRLVQRALRVGRAFPSNLSLANHSLGTPRGSIEAACRISEKVLAHTSMFPSDLVNLRRRDAGLAHQHVSDSVVMVASRSASVDLLRKDTVAIVLSNRVDAGCGRPQCEPITPPFSRPSPPMSADRLVGRTQNPHHSLRMPHTF
jgi:hypothetical protein